MSISQKEIEELHISKLISMLDLKGQLSMTVKDPPDCIFRTNEGLISIEHTTIHHNKTAKKTSSPSARRSLILSICEMAKNHYLNINSKHVWICPQLKYQLKISKKETKIAAIELAEFVAEISEENFSGMGYFRTHKLKYFHGVEINMHPNLKNSKWYYAEGVQILEMAIETIHEVVGQKEIQLEKYKSLYTSCWLLIVINHLNSIWYDINKKELQNAFKTSFDKVFLLDWRSYSLHTINNV